VVVQEGVVAEDIHIISYELSQDSFTLLDIND
jgi:hypothetical protein